MIVSDLLVVLDPNPFTEVITTVLGVTVAKLLGYTTEKVKSLVAILLVVLEALLAEVTTEPTGAVITYELAKGDGVIV